MKKVDGECVERSRRRSGGSPLRESRPRSGATGLDHAPVGQGSAAGAARRRQRLGEDARQRSQRRCGRCSLRQRLRLGYGLDRARGPAGGAARAAVKTSRTRKTSRRGDGAAAACQFDRSGGAESIRRGAAARVHRAQIHRPHRFHRGACAHRSARRGSVVPRGFWRARRLRAIPHAGFWTGQGCGGGIRCRSIRRRPDPRQARHFQLRRRRPASLRTHDHAVDPGVRPAGAGAAYGEYYKGYFDRNNARVGGIKTILDPMPRVVLVPGVGLFGLGRSKKDAKIAADLAEAAVATITDADAVGRFEPLPESDLFDVEYWSLEQAKLGNAREPPLAGQVSVITGAAGAIGFATAKAFAAAGAEVALLDVDEAAAQVKAKAIGGAALGLRCDVTDAVSVKDAFAQVASAFGGVDIAVSNAGAAWQGRIGEVDESVLRESFELNFYGHQRVGQAAVRIMRAQGTGGCLLFNCSKKAVNPAADFGPYGLPKAATLFLGRQYALDYGSQGIRANAVNADRIRSGLLTEEMIASRSRARGLSEQAYMRGNLLGREVAAEDVAQAFLAQALALKTTADVTTVDGGNIAAALR